MTSKVIASFYMENIAADVVRHQCSVLQKFVPADFAILQTLTSLTHAAVLDEFMNNIQQDLVVFLDIDCVPLTPDAIPSMAAHAAQGKLAGCVQRANHISNNAHVYVGPFCMAITRQLWERLGRPSFQPTGRGDVGEEVTYRCEEIGQPIHMLWPSSVETPLWDLTDRQKFGVNTEYGGSFLHTFSIRDPRNQRIFVDRCRDIVGYLDSDRHYWHRYTDRYEQALASLGVVRNVLEFGVLEGASIRWLQHRFPEAGIVGVDIIAPRPAWPRNDRIAYAQADQGDSRAIGAMFESLGRQYDLIIDDGGHLPPDQASCLIKGFPFVRPGGLYIIEDIHSSHPHHPDFRQYNPPGVANCLHVLLAMQHLKDRRQLLTPEITATLTTPGFFSPDDLQYLFGNIQTMDLYKRTSLPLRCYRCGSDSFDYKQLRCSCGADIYAATDSMSFILRKTDSAT
jgi:hypothetical protein